MLVVVKQFGLNNDTLQTKVTNSKNKIVDDQRDYMYISLSFNTVVRPEPDRVNCMATEDLSIETFPETLL